MRLHFEEDSRFDPHSPDFNPWPNFTAAMRRLVPDMAEGAVVYEVDAFGLDAPNTQLTAGVLKDGELISETIETRIVSKEWLRSFVEEWQMNEDKLKEQSLEADISEGPGCEI